MKRTEAIINSDILVRDFIESEERKNLSRDNLNRKRSFLSKYLVSVSGRIIPMTRKDLEIYLSNLRDSFSLSLIQYNNYCSWLNQFYSYLVDRELIDDNPAAGLERMKIKRKAKCSVFSPEEIKDIMESALTPRKRKSIIIMKRDRAIIELFYSSALRLSELIGLDRDDIDFNTGEVFIREGKGNKERIVPVGEEACRYIFEYLIIRKYFIKQGGEYNALFISRQGNRMSKPSVMRMLLRRKSEAGIKKEGTSHIYRRSCASHMLANGAPTGSIKRLLGHSSSETTAEYITVSKENLKAIYKKSHPRAD